MQVDESVRTYGRTVPLRSTVVYGGIPMDPQIKALRGGVEILVATPGRLLDLVGQQVANLGQVEILVLDEADRMLDMGFLPDIQKIIALLPPQAPEPDVLGDLLGRHPAPVGRRSCATRRRSRSRRGTRPLEAIHQLVYPVDRDRKEALLAHLIRKDDLRQVLVFTRTKLAASRLANAARPRGPRRGRDPLGPLAAGADARARGLQDRRDPGPRRDRRRGPRARHRGPAASSSTSSCRGTRRTTSTGSAGPAGRARRGEAISLVCIDETDLLRGVQRMLKQAIPWTVEEGFIPDRDAEPRPLGARAGHARTTPEHHAHRKPVRRRAGAGSGRRRLTAEAAPGAGSAGSATAVRRRPPVGADRIDDGAREEEPEHQVGPDPLDVVAVDQRVVAERDAGLRPVARTDSRMSRSSTNSPDRPGQGAARVEAGQRRRARPRPCTARTRGGCGATRRGPGCRDRRRRRR